MHLDTHFVDKEYLSFILCVSDMFVESQWLPNNMLHFYANIPYYSLNYIMQLSITCIFIYEMTLGSAMKLYNMLVSFQHTPL